MKLMNVDIAAGDLPDRTNGVIGQAEPIMPVRDAGQRGWLTALDIAYLAEAALERYHIWTGLQWRHGTAVSTVDDPPLDVRATLPTRLTRLVLASQLRNIASAIYSANQGNEADPRYGNGPCWCTLPNGFDPRHATGKNGDIDNVYDYYVRRHLMARFPDDLWLAERWDPLTKDYFAKANPNGGMYTNLGLMKRPVVHIRRITDDRKLADSEESEYQRLVPGSFPTWGGFICEKDYYNYGTGVDMSGCSAFCYPASTSDFALRVPWSGQNSTHLTGLRIYGFFQLHCYQKDYNRTRSTSEPVADEDFSYHIMYEITNLFESELEEKENEDDPDFMLFRFIDDGGVAWKSFITREVSFMSPRIPLDGYAAASVPSSSNYSLERRVEITPHYFVLLGEMTRNSIWN